MAAVTAIPGVVFSGGLDGHLRAYDAAGGRIIWDVDTKGSYQTVNETTAFGGSLDGPGPVVVDGMLYVTSGYAHLGGAPGNAVKDRQYVAGYRPAGVENSTQPEPRRGNGPSRGSARGMAGACCPR